MTMRLATEPTLISHAGSTVRLRPSLRAAYLLERKYGLQRLYQGISTGHCGIVLDILKVTADDPERAVRIFDLQIVKEGVASLRTFADQLYAVLAASYGIDDESEHSTDAKPQPGQSFDTVRALTNLFEIGTGWLGWSPADTWSATPAEIMAAHKGLIAKLQAIHGGGENSDQPAYDPGGEISPEELQASIATLRAIVEQGRA
jgi:hypothetical protein